MTYAIPNPGRGRRLGTWCRQHPIKSTIILLLLLAAVAGGAYAAWSLTGSGEGRAQAGGAPQAVTLTQTAVSTAGQIGPGGTGAVAYSAHNPNPYTVSITSIQLNDPSSTNMGGCDVNNFSLVNPSSSQIAVHQTIPANGDMTFEVPNLVRMDANAPEACENAAVRIIINATGVSGS